MWTTCNVLRNTPPKSNHLTKKSKSIASSAILIANVIVFNNYDDDDDDDNDQEQIPGEGVRVMVMMMVVMMMMTMMLVLIAITIGTNPGGGGGEVQDVPTNSVPQL